MAQCQIRGGVHQRLPKRGRRSEQLASVLHVLQSRADSSSVGLSNASAGVYEQIRRVFSNGCVLSYFRPKTVLTFGTTIAYARVSKNLSHIHHFGTLTSDRFRTSKTVPKRSSKKVLKPDSIQFILHNPIHSKFVRITCSNLADSANCSLSFAVSSFILSSKSSSSPSISSNPTYRPGVSTKP
jgi:hypothetical protein